MLLLLLLLEAIKAPATVQAHEHTSASERKSENKWKHSTDVVRLLALLPLSSSSSSICIHIYIIKLQKFACLHKCIHAYDGVY